MNIDIGYYNANPDLYQSLINDLYAAHPPITLPPEYASFFKNDLLRLLIRLARYKFVARLVRKTDRVLEVGSGSGVGCTFLAQHCAHATGIDVKTTEVEEARSINRRENVTFVCATCSSSRRSESTMLFWRWMSSNTCRWSRATNCSPP